MSTDPSLQLSVLDLSPVTAGSTSAEALRNTLDLARLADSLGYTRYWLAEHHNTGFIASSVPAIMIGQVAAVTGRIRVGSGGVMLPNHAPLSVAEAFRTLEALYPGRVDLGIGRAPGTDSLTALALRGSRQALGAEDFPDQLDDLLGFFSGNLPADHPFRNVRAMPDGVPAPEIWLLGSSLFSAQLSASMGLGFAFAHHIDPGPAVDALRLYQELFRPSSYLRKPHAMVAVSAICAPTDEEAEELSRPIELALLLLRQGRLGPLPGVDEATAYPYTLDERESIERHRARLFVGSPATVHQGICRLVARAGVDEVMVTTVTHSHEDRRRSYQLLAEVFGIKPG